MNFLTSSLKPFVFFMCILLGKSLKAQESILSQIASGNNIPNLSSISYNLDVTVKLESDPAKKTDTLIAQELKHHFEYYATGTKWRCNIYIVESGVQTLVYKEASDGEMSQSLALRSGKMIVTREEAAVLISNYKNFPLSLLNFLDDRPDRNQQWLKAPPLSFALSKDKWKSFASSAKLVPSHDPLPKGIEICSGSSFPDKFNKGLYHFSIFYANPSQFFPTTVQKLDAHDKLSSSANVKEFLSTKISGREFEWPSHMECKLYDGDAKLISTNDIQLSNLKINQPIEENMFSIDLGFAREIYDRDTNTIIPMSSIPVH